MKTSVSPFLCLRVIARRVLPLPPRHWHVRPALCSPLILRPALTIRFSTAQLCRKQAADNPDFVSIVDNPPVLVRSGQKHGIGLIVLAVIPITAFALGCWQVKRLDWKTQLIAKLEDRLLLDPLPLPPHIDPSAVRDFDYRRVYANGRLRHDQEMLVGPRMREGQQGYLVVTPLERDGDGTSILVNRGWISSKKAARHSRPDSLIKGTVTVEGLLRQPWEKNMFTPTNRPDKGEFYFPDVQEMAKLAGTQPIWVEATTEPEYLKFLDYEARGIPIGRAAEVNLSNNHTQYIFTWYGLALATSIMFWMVAKKPSRDVTRRVRMNKHW